MTNVDPSSIGDAGLGPKPPKRPWPLALAGAAGLATWIVTRDAGLALASAGLLLAAFPPDRTA